MRYRKGYCFLLKIYIMVKFSSPHNEATLNHATHTVSVLFLRYSVLAGQNTYSKNALGEILPSHLQRLEGGGGLNNNILGGYFKKLISRGDVY